MRLGTVLAGLALAMSFATGALSQDAGPQPSGVQSLESPPDWDVVQQDRDTLIATVVYTPGLAIGVRCKWGRELDAFLYGLPESDEPWIRPLELSDEDGDFSQQNWASTTDPTTAFNLLPARFARSLREGGVLQVRARDAQGRRIRYVMDLPTSPTAIDRVLTACGKPTVDPRDAQLEAAGPVTSAPLARDWARRPRPEYPRAGEGLAWGSATLSCIADPAGVLDDCVVESEYPRGYDFGREALRAMPQARLTPGGPDAVSSLAVFTVRFRMAGYDPSGNTERRRLPEPGGSLPLN